MRNSKSYNHKPAHRTHDKEYRKNKSQRLHAERTIEHRNCAEYVANCNHYGLGVDYE